MLNWLMVPVFLHLTTVSEVFYEPEASEEVAAILADAGDVASPEDIRAIEALAAKGDDSAAELLGEMYLLGALGTPRDAIRGCQYFESIAERRPLARHNLATCYQFGEGRAQDLGKARSLFRAAAEGGSRMSYCAYGNMLVSGEGGPKDIAEGLRLCRMTAVAGDRDAQTDYGGYLLMGVGGERDPVTARFMLEQAGEQGQRNAAFLLGQIYQKGDGIEADPVQSGEWFEKAYEWGREDAAFQVAMQLVRRGYQQEDESVRVSPGLLREAVGWLEIAAENDPRPEQRQEAGNLIPNIEKLISAASQ